MMYPSRWFLWSFGPDPYCPASTIQKELILNPERCNSFQFPAKWTHLVEVVFKVVGWDPGIQRFVTATDDLDLAVILEQETTLAEIVSNEIEYFVRNALGVDSARRNQNIILKIRLGVQRTAGSYWRSRMPAVAASDILVRLRLSSGTTRSDLFIQFPNLETRSL